MPLATGSTLGPYQIRALLGAGGMGEVYRAHDPRLQRDVAIKVLPAERLSDDIRKRRFVEEARRASALNHPNIVTIYEIDAVDGIDFIVMELVEGKTLDVLLARQRVPLVEALRIGSAMADALARAHGAGIVHRDLKPSNVALDLDGTVKLLDFGLAKLVGPDEPAEPIGATAPTATAELEERPGTVAGTPGYMSPEQASGQKVDARSDVFGFGAVLYEMVTGRRAFGGSSPAETRGAVLNQQPRPASDVVAGVPQQLERLIQRCLRKEPERRYQHILDVKVELEEIRESESTAGPQPAEFGRTARVAAALVAVVALLAFAAWLARSRLSPEPPLRVEPLTATSGLEWAPAFSPDGQQVAFAWDGEKGGQHDIYVKMVGSSEALRLTSDPGGEYWPAWSPDGRQIAFLRYARDEARIYTVSPLGGTVRRLSDLACAGPLDWSPDGKWLAAWRPASGSGAQPAGIWLIPAEGDEPRVLVPALPEGDVRAPAFSPDGRQLAYAACVSRQPPTPCDIHLVRLDAQLMPQGAPRRLTRQAFSIGRLAWARDGRSILYDAESGPYTVYLWRVSVDGAQAPERVEVAGVGPRYPSIATSGARMAFTRVFFEHDILRFEAGHPHGLFLDSSFYDGKLAFSPDGRRIAFETMRSGERNEIWLAQADGSNPSQLTRGPGGWQGSPAWSPDGRRIAFDSRSEDGHWDIWTIGVEGGPPLRVTRDPGDENVPSWSRDGRWVYYGSDRDGGPGIFRVPADGGAAEQLIRTAVWGGAEESVDGRSLFFRRGRGATPLVAHSLAGGTEVTLVQCVQGMPGFVVAENGIYYVPCSHGNAVLHRLDPRTRRDTVLGELDRYGGMVFASPEGNTVLYQRFARMTADLVLIGNWR